MILKKITVIALGTIVSLSIFAINLWLIYPWFQGVGPLNLGSIEVSYVSMARFLRDFYPHLSFAPYWYFGFPFCLFYTPLLPLLEVILNILGKVPFWQAYRIISGFGFILAPVSLFLFVWSLTRKIIPGILTALFYTFGPSIFYFILESNEVARDIITVSPQFFDPRRLVILARWGEGPHTFSLVFLPLAGLFYLRLLETKKFSNLIFTAIFIGLTALTNAVGFYALITLLVAIFFGEITKKENDTSQLFKLTIKTILVSYGLIAFWYNLSFIFSFFGEGGGVLGNYLSLFPWGWILLTLIGFFLFTLFKKVIKNQAIAFSFLWFLILFLIVYIYYTSAPSDFSEARIEYAPQALRLMTEVDMALAVFLAVLIDALVSLIKRKIRVIGVIGEIGEIILIGGILFYGFSYLPYGQKAVTGEVNLKETYEYKISSWLSKNVNQKMGERVYVAGNYGFYLNYFTNIWQLRGGLYQAKTHYWPEHIFYQVNMGKKKDISLNWLKAANIKFLVVNTFASKELYKDFKTPDKFKDLKVVYEKDGDIIYQVPLSSSIPAKVVDLSKINNIKAPQKADDEEPLAGYVEWLDQSRPADFEVINNNLYKIKTKLYEGEGILIQMTYDQGFSVSSNYGGLRIVKDPLDFILLLPKRSGDYEIFLSHGKTWKIYLGYLITLITILGLILSFIRPGLVLLQSQALKNSEGLSGLK